MQRVSLSAFRRNMRPRARLSHYIQLFLGKIVQIYTHVLIILNTIVYAKCQPVCIQMKHQDTNQTFPLHLVIFRKNSTNIYRCTNNIKHDSLCKGSACVHSDETSGRETDFTITFSYFQVKYYKYCIYPCANNTKYDSLCKGSACVHSDETSGHERDFPVTFSYFQEKQYKYCIYPSANNIKYDSLCKGSACVHSDETSGHEPDFPITFSYFQEKQYKYIPMY